MSFGIGNQFNACQGGNYGNYGGCQPSRSEGCDNRFGNSFGGQNECGGSNLANTLFNFITSQGGYHGGGIGGGDNHGGFPGGNHGGFPGGNHGGFPGGGHGGFPGGDHGGFPGGGHGGVNPGGPIIVGPIRAGQPPHEVDPQPGQFYPL